MKNNSKKTNKQNTTRARAQASGRRVSRRTKDDRRRILFSKKHVKMETRRALYGTTGGASYALARGTDLNRRFVAAFLALVFAISTMVIGLNIVTSAEDHESVASTKSAEFESNLVLDKYITPQEDGTYDLTLSAFAKGTIKNTTTQVPTDFIFVVDQSGSMSYKDMPLGYQAADKTTWTIRDIQPQYDPDTEKDTSTAYYYKDPETGDYYRVYAKWGAMYELVPRQSLYLQALIDRSGLSWFRSAGEQTKSFDSIYYYQPSYDPLIDNSLHPDRDLANDNHFYPLTMSIQNAPLYYYMTFNYKDYNGISRQMRYYYNADEQGTDQATSNAIWYYNPLDRQPFGPGDSIWLIFNISYNYLNRVVVYAAGNNMSPVSALASATFSGSPDPGFYDHYTYAEVGQGFNTGMYVQNPMFIGHVGYNELCYRDSKGVEHYLIKTDYCNENDVPLETADGTEEATWNGTLYTIAEESGTPKTEARLQSLVTALGNFVNSVENQAAEYNTEHRIAIVGFSSQNNGSNAYNNNELLTTSITDGGPGSMGTTPGVTSGYSLDGKTHDGALYADGISDATYYSSLASTVSDEGKATLSKAVNSITAYGGTQPEIGLEMARNIIRTRNDREGTNNNRNTIVVFFTDGRPGNYSYVNQYVEAGEVISKAKEVKDLGATLYTIGVFNESDGNPLTYREDYSTGNSGDYSGTNTYMKYYKYDDLYAKWYDATCQNTNFGHNHIGSNSRVRDEFTMDQTIILLNNNNYFLYPSGKFQQQYRTDFVRKTEDASTFSYRWDWGTIQSHYSTATGIPYYRESFYYRDCKANTYGYPEQPNDTIADYMTVVSSTYPSATSFDGGWSKLSYATKNAASSVYNNAIGSARGTRVGENYYMSASNADKLEEVFINIAGMETVPAVDTNASFILQDVISDSFHVELDSQNPNDTLADHVEVKELVGWQDDEYNFHFKDISEATSSSATPTSSADNKTLSVRNFNFVENYIAYGKPADYNGSGNLANHGKKLIVTIHDVVPNDTGSGTWATNGAGSSIIMEEPGEGSAVISTPIEDFESPEITRRKYALNVGSVHNAGVFYVDYELSTEGTAKTQSIVTRNAKEGKRYSELTDGQFKAMAPGDNNTWTDTVGNGNTVYVEYITKQPSKDTAAPPVVDPADYTLEATVTNANTAENKAKYKYYLSNDHYLQPSEQDDSANGNGLNSQTRTVSLGTSADGNLYVNSKTNNRTVIIKETVDGKFANANDEFTPTLYLVPPEGQQVPAEGATYGDVNWEIDGTNNRLKYTTKAILGDNTDSVSLTVPANWTLLVEQTDEDNYAVTDKEYVLGTSGTSTDIPAGGVDITDDLTITITNTRDDIPVTGVNDSSNFNWIIYILVAVAVFAVIGAGIFLWKKKDEFVEE